MELVSTIDKAAAGSADTREYEPGRECCLFIPDMELETKVRKVFIITEKAPTRALS